MIVDLLIDIVSWTANLVGSALPTINLSLPSGLFGILDWAVMYDQVLPLHEAFLVLAFIIATTVGLFMFKWSKQLIDWLMDIIP